MRKRRKQDDGPVPGERDAAFAAVLDALARSEHAPPGLLEQLRAGGPAALDALTATPELGGGLVLEQAREAANWPPEQCTVDSSDPRYPRLVCAARLRWIAVDTTIASWPKLVSLDAGTFNNGAYSPPLAQALPVAADQVAELVPLLLREVDDHRA